MPAVMLPSHSWPQAHPPSFLLRMQSQRSTRTSPHALLLSDTAQVGTRSSLTSLPEATGRTLSCSSQPDSLWETKLRRVPWVRVQPACHPTAAQEHHLSHSRIVAKPTEGLTPRQVKSCRPSVNTQRPNIYRNEIFPTSSLSSRFSC